MVGEGGVVGCLRGSSVVGEISLCSLRSPSPHNVCNYSYGSGGAAQG